MVRVTNAVAANRKRKRLLKQAKGFVGDRKNHIRLSADAVMSAMAFNYKHRKQKKRDFKRLWIVLCALQARRGHGCAVVSQKVSQSAGPVLYGHCRRMRVRDALWFIDGGGPGCTGAV